MKQLFLCIILSALPLRAQTVTIDAHVGGDMGGKITNAANSVICLNGCTINVPPGAYALTTTAKLPNGRKNIKLIATGTVLTGNAALNTMISVPLLHFRRKTAAFRSLPPWVCDPESAAFGCNKSTNKDEQGRLSTIDAPPIRGSALFVAPARVLLM